MVGTGARFASCSWITTNGFAGGSADRPDRSRGWSGSSNPLSATATATRRFADLAADFTGYP